MSKSNLGMYQWITTASKKVHGPGKLIALLVGGGAIIGAGGVKAKQKISSSRNKKKQKLEATIVHTVTEEGRSNEGLLFAKGDTFRVIETDGDACLIDKIGDENSPYYVSLNFLCSISDYKQN